ncbi:hypothetical protein ACWDTI_23525 [Gordonia sp. NPDC003424]
MDNGTPRRMPEAAGRVRVEHTAEPGMVFPTPVVLPADSRQGR